LAARALLTSGIAWGDRVAVWAPNCAQWIIAALAIHSIGAILVPVSTRMKAAEVGDILERSGARLLFVIGEFLGQYYPDMLTTPRSATLERIVVLGTARPVDLDWKTFLALSEQTPTPALEQRLAAVPDLLNFLDDDSLDSDTRSWIYGALRLITGEPLGNDTHAWQEWWAHHDTPRKPAAHKGILFA